MEVGPMPADRMLPRQIQRLWDRARHAMTRLRAWAASSPEDCARLRAKIERAERERALLGEELRIKKAARIEKIPDPHRNQSEL